MFRDKRVISTENPKLRQVARPRLLQRKDRESSKHSTQEWRQEHRAVEGLSSQTKEMKGRDEAWGALQGSALDSI